jgi:hypothetical protein
VIKRTLDGSFLNEVANHPEVRPWLLGDGPLDVGPAVSDPANITLVTEHGGWVLHNLGGGVYEVHSLFLPEGRGRAVRVALTEALDYVFSHTDCIRITTRLPKGNVRARALAKMAGFRPWFVSQGDERARIEIEDWAQSSEACRVAGHWFHERLEAAKVDAGSALVVHDDDDAHDHAVGAAVLMCRAANPVKAVAIYNAWAQAAGYALISLVSSHPMVIDVVDAVLEGPDMKVLKCR